MANSLLDLSLLMRHVTIINVYSSILTITCHRVTIARYRKMLLYFIVFFDALGLYFTAL